MKRIQLIHAANTISRHRQRLQQDLAFSMLVENMAYDKLVEVKWAGEDRVWQTLPATHRGSIDGQREIWCAQASFTASDDASLPGDVEFALHYRARGKDYWDNEEGGNHRINADSGVWLHPKFDVRTIDYTPHLHGAQRYYPVTVAVRGGLQPTRVNIHWTTDNWRSTWVTPCFSHRMYWDRLSRSSARNPNQYDTCIWSGQLKIDDAYRIQYAVCCETPNGIIWDNNFGYNYVSRRRPLKILTLNLHCYQEDNQDAKFSQIARAINDLGIDIACLQEVAEPWNDGAGDWNANAAKIIRERLNEPYHLHTDWSHLGFDRYREGVAILSRYDFTMTDSGYVSESHDVYSINSRKVVMAQVNVPHMGLVNVFSAHLSWPSGGFFSQFERLRAWANSKHGTGIAATFLCGDFNIKAGSDGYQAVVHTREFEDQYLAVTAQGVFDKIFRQRSPDIERCLARDGRIDYVFMQNTSQLHAVAAQELFTHAHYGRVSDHTGYCVEFEPH